MFEIRDHLYYSCLETQFIYVNKKWNEFEMSLPCCMIHKVSRRETIVAVTVKNGTEENQGTTVVHFVSKNFSLDGRLK
jgi:hypothetical protein